MNINFVSFNMLNRLLIQNLHRIPHDIDVIVGIPRSGLILANMISCYANKPLTDIAGVISSRLFEAGNTKNKSDWVRDFSTVKKILIVEDSVASGNSIKQVKERLALINVEKIYLAAIVEPKSVDMVDLFFAVVPQPRMFEWNCMHHSLLKNCCVNLDGVLCQDSDVNENYRKVIRSVAPKLLPSQPIGWIVTTRPKKYVNETQSWLRKNNIHYGNLIMSDIDLKKRKKILEAHATFKSEVYRSIEEAILFIEREYNQAKMIAQISKKDVFCVESGNVIRGGGMRIRFLLFVKKILECHDELFCRRAG